ncbi:MAG: phosphotriesterase-related protein, partial [Rhodospirillaceae bacterium]|nr:phosphotriesterase-related protein [Rhodospirillaceae bacterium]
GYGYILRHFVPRLMRHGLDRAAIDRLLIDNPRRVFSARHRNA